MDGEAWGEPIIHGVTESQTLLRDQTTTREMRKGGGMASTDILVGKERLGRALREGHCADVTGTAVEHLRGLSRVRQWDKKSQGPVHAARWAHTLLFRLGHLWEWREVEVAQSCPALCDPVDYTVHGIVQTRTLEWAAIPFSRGSSQPRDPTQDSGITGGFFTSEPPGKSLQVKESTKNN